MSTVLLGDTTTTGMNGSGLSGRTAFSPDMLCPGCCCAPAIAPLARQAIAFEFIPTPGRTNSAKHFQGRKKGKMQDRPLTSRLAESVPPPSPDVVPCSGAA